MKGMWRFPESNSGKIRGISSGDVELFKKAPIAQFAREILQNSIDAADSDEEPVRVEFEKFEMSPKNLPGLKEYLNQVIRCEKFFKGMNDYKSYCEKIISVLQREKISVLRVSDFNTIGLLGIHTTKLEDNHFLAITKGTGFSAKGTGLSAGSKGVGKNAAINLSSSRIVFYATKTKDGHIGSIGVSELISGYTDDEVAKKEDNSKYTQGSGYFEDPENNNTFVIKEIIKFKNDYKEREHKTGTDIYIIGFNEEPDWKNQIINSALESFMATFARNKLEINVDGIEINSKTLNKIVYSELIREENRASVVSQYRILKGDGKVKTFDIETDYGVVELYVLPLEDNEASLATHNCTAIRHPLMKIKNFPIGKHLQVSALCIIKDDKLGAILRDIENPQHSDWETKRIEDSSVRKEVSNTLKFIRDKIQEYVVSCLKQKADLSIDPLGAGEFLPENTSELKTPGRSNKKKLTDKTIVGKKRENTSKFKPGLSESDDEDNQGVIPDIGGIDPNSTGDVLYVDRTKNGKRKKNHPGEDNLKKIEGNSVIFRKANLKVVKYAVVCIDKSKGAFKIVFNPIESREDCYIRINLLDDANEKMFLPIDKITHKGKDLTYDESVGGYGKFSVKQGEKVEIYLITKIKKNFGSGVSVLC